MMPVYNLGGDIILEILSSNPVRLSPVLRTSSSKLNRKQHCFFGDIALVIWGIDLRKDSKILKFKPVEKNGFNHMREMYW
jgi:hypothetical protein